MERENYYILLELPADVSNRGKIDAAIKKNRLNGQDFAIIRVKDERLNYILALSLI